MNRLWLYTISIILFLFLGISLGFSLHAIRQEQLNCDLNKAIKANRFEQAIALLHAGADANTRDTPEDVRPLWQRFLDLLRARRPGESTEVHPTALLIASATEGSWNSYGHPPCSETETIRLVSALLNEGAKVNEKDNWGDTALLNALIGGHLLEAQLLLDHGADAHGVVSDDIGSSVWNAGGRGAQWLSSEPLLCSLIRQGADVNLMVDTCDRGIFGTPICQAVLEGKDNPETVKMISILVDAGAKVNVKNTNECTPLMEAVYGDQPIIARFLIAHGADVNSTDIRGDTVLDIALAGKQEEIVRMLRQAGAKTSWELSASNRR